LTRRDGNDTVQKLALKAGCGKPAPIFDAGFLLQMRPRWGTFTCVMWQATLCDPIWHVTLRTSEMGFPVTTLTPSQSQPLKCQTNKWPESNLNLQIQQRSRFIPFLLDVVHHVFNCRRVGRHKV